MRQDSLFYISTSSVWKRMGKQKTEEKISLTCPIRGLLAAEWRTQAAATSIILNISLSTYFFSSLGSARPSNSSLSSALLNNGRAWKYKSFSQKIWSQNSKQVKSIHAICSDFSVVSIYHNIGIRSCDKICHK